MFRIIKYVSKTTNLRLLCTQVAYDIQVNPPHTPVMVQEVLNYLKPQPDRVILDMTFGAGGHSRRILESAPNIKLLALDRDPVAFDYMTKLNEDYPNQVIPLQGRFSELPDLLKTHNIHQSSIDGVLFDFGCSSMQFDTAERGFSVSKDGPLDMRMDGNRFPDNPTAADILASATEEDIYKIIKIYGEEKQARKIARAIVEARYLFKRLATTEELADLVDSVCEEEYRLDKLQRRAHNATKTFQALRIFVNNELNEINYGLILARKYLKLGGRLVAITFHSLEDTIVKRHLLGNLVQNMANALPLKYSSHALDINKGFIDGAMESNWKSLHKHVIIPRLEEVEDNPRSRSAKLRAAVRVK
ncbi:hypothetical protein ILUMI_06412 [Ignelater luminosus]|uniref:Methyltransferase-like protein 15 homolog n=1 Tax=Ignelater luminosus TaxID=2038154 RepID=A0A8K0GCL7_IGNLU|nr:hypothetical protein ILUMI_06412 [Ignelater luminosus]